MIPTISLKYMTQQNPKRELVLRNCQTDFNGDEILEECEKFDQPYFDSVRDGGYNAIWIHAALRNLVTFEEAPHWNDRNVDRVAALNRIIAQGSQSGISVYLYITEPKGLKEGDPIFDKYPDLKGPVNPLALRPQYADVQPKYAFCTRCEFTETYLTGGFRKLFSQCADLAGIIMITASEIVSHCYSNVDVKNLLNEDFKYREVLCPRCKNFSAGQTAVDVIEKVRKGIRASSSTAKLVAWNWSWGMYEEAPQREMISALSKDVIIMCDLQRGGNKTVEGFDIFVDEYSFSYLGPSQLFNETAGVAKERGHELWTKMPVNVTHEFLSVPYLPLPFRLAKKTISVRNSASTGMVCCWNYGGDATTLMARLASEIFHDETFSPDRINPRVRSIAEEIYGKQRGEAGYRAWQEYDIAFEYFPFEIPLIYYGPHMHGPGFEWVFTREDIPMPEYYLNKAGRRGTKLSDWCVRFTPQEVVSLLGKLTDRWRKGIEILAESFGVSQPFDAMPEFESLVSEPGFDDWTYGRTIYLHFLSTIDFIKFRLATLDFFEDSSPRAAQRTIIKGLLEAEKPRIRAMRQIIQSYPNIGYAEEAQKHLFTVSDLDQRLANMERFSFEEGQEI